MATKTARKPLEILEDIADLCNPNRHIPAGTRPMGQRHPRSAPPSSPVHQAQTLLAARKPNTTFDRSTRGWVITGYAKKFTTRQIYYARASAADPKAKPPLPEWQGRYLMVTDSTEVPAMLQALGFLSSDIGEDGESILVFPSHVLEANEKMASLYQELLDVGCICLFDEREDDAILKSELAHHSVTGSPQYFASRVRYNGPKIDDALLFVILRQKFLDQVSRTWNSIITPRNSNHSVRGRITSSIARASKFASLLLLGHGDFSVFSKKAKAPKWKAETLMRMDIPSSLCSDQLREAAEAVEKLEDVCALWENSSESYWVKMTLDVGDLDTETDLDKRFDFIGRTFGVDTLISGLEAGLSANDLLAGGPTRGY